MTWTLVVALTAAVPAFGIFGIPSPDELLIWLVLRPMMHGNQRVMIANQLLELQELVDQLRTAQQQLSHVRDRAQGLIGAITDPMAGLVATPTDLLSTARGWHSDFTGPAGDMVRSIRDLAGNGESFSRSWRDVLQASDTVTAADIRTIYQSGPNAADTAVATFERQRAEGERRLGYAEARADAGADLMQLREATAGAMNRISERVDDDPDAGGPNRSPTALIEGDAVASLAQLRALIGIGRSRAVAATETAADRFRQEQWRREIEARRLAERVALETVWVQEQAIMATRSNERIAAMYGGYRLHPFFSGN